MARSRAKRQMKPKLIEGEYVFCLIKDLAMVPRNETIMEFKTDNGISIIIERSLADKLGLPYTYIASWITLEFFTTLEEVGLTALFSQALAKNGISCNVVAGYHHDHIFVRKSDAIRSIKILQKI